MQSRGIPLLLVLVVHSAVAQFGIGASEPLPLPPSPPPNACRVGGGTSPGRICFLDNSNPRNCVQWCDSGDPMVTGIEACTDPLPSECIAPFVPPTTPPCACPGPVRYDCDILNFPNIWRCFDFCFCTPGGIQVGFLNPPGVPGACGICRAFGLVLPSGIMCHDPHFRTLSGGKPYDFHGLPNSVFNIISDPFVQLNSKFVTPSHGDHFLENHPETANVTTPTFIGEIGFRTGQDVVTFDADTCTATLNGKVIDGQASTPYMRVTHSFILPEVRHTRYKNVGHSVIHTNDWEIAAYCDWTSKLHVLDLQIIYKRLGEEEMHIPEGIMGQTAEKKDYHALPQAKQGEGIIKGVMEDYKVHEEDVLGTDYLYRQFHSSNIPTPITPDV